MVRRTLDKEVALIECLHEYNVLLDSREIFLHGSSEDEEDPGVDYRNANKLLKNLRLLETKEVSKPIIIHQHSIGGCWFSGMMMYDAIIHCKSPVLFICHGEASSMGSIVPQAADKRVVMPNCYWLVHDGSTEIDGSMTMRQSKSWHEMEQNMHEKMMEIYTEVCENGEFFADGYESDAITAYIEGKMAQKEDWFLTAREAVKYGFADAVIGDDDYESIKDIVEKW